MSRLFLISTPIGNLGDMTPRAIEVLKSVDLIACEDTRVSGILLKHFGIDKPKVSYHKFNESARTASLIKRFEDDDFSMAVISDAGTPAISDPGAILVSAAREAGAEILVVPGASAVVSAVAASGFKNTHFAFLGFYPRQTKKRKEALAVTTSNYPLLLVFFESPFRIIACLKSISEILGENTPISVSKELTKLHEKTLTGTVSEILETLQFDKHTQKGEYVVVIGN